MVVKSQPFKLISRDWHRKQKTLKFVASHADQQFTLTNGLDALGHDTQIKCCRHVDNGLDDQSGILTFFKVTDKGMVNFQLGSGKSAQYRQTRIAGSEID